MYSYIPGGQIGLWVGMSVITLFEILKYISQILHVVMRCGCHGNKEVAKENRDEVSQQKEIGMQCRL